jgi:casein kinase II subunit beta
MNASNLAPGLGKGKMYEPKIYGFKVSERARSGPRMQWLRDRPNEIRELDEAAIFHAEHPDESEDEAVSTNGAVVPRPAPRRVRRANGGSGSPMSIEANGEPFT